MAKEMITNTSHHLNKSNPKKVRILSTYGPFILHSAPYRHLFVVPHFIINSWEFNAELNNTLVNK